MYGSETSGCSTGASRSSSSSSAGSGATSARATATAPRTGRNSTASKRNGPTGRHRERPGRRSSRRRRRPRAETDPVDDGSPPVAAGHRRPQHVLDRAGTGRQHDETIEAEGDPDAFGHALGQRSEEHTSELQSLMRNSYAV